MYTGVSLYILYSDIDPLKIVESDCVGKTVSKMRKEGDLTK